MTVEVTKRCTKAKDGDIYPKKDKATGWWIDAKSESPFFLDGMQRQKLADIGKHRIYYVPLPRRYLGKVCTKIIDNYRGISVGLRSYYTICPLLSSFPAGHIVRTIFTEEEYEKLVTQKYSIHCRFGIVTEHKSTNVSRLTIEKDYVRYPTQPDFIFDILMEQIGVKSQ